MAVLRIPDPNKPPFPYNLPVSDDEDIKMLISLITELSIQVAQLEDRVQKLESQKLKRRFP